MLKKCKIITMGLMVFILFLPACSFVLGQSYSLRISEGDELIWELTDVDEDYYSGDAYEIGNEFKMEIDDIDEDSEKWSVSTSVVYLIGSSGEYSFDVYKDPEEAIEVGLNPLGMFVIPVDAQSYLKGMAGDMDGLSVSGRTIEYEFTDLDLKEQLIFNGDGILQKVTYYIDDDLIYEMTLTKGLGLGMNLILPIIIVSIIGAVAVIGIIILRKRGKNKQIDYKSEGKPTVPKTETKSTPIPSQPPKEEKPPQKPTVVGKCPSCGAEIEEGAVFCFECGESIN